MSDLPLFKTEEGEEVAKLKTQIEILQSEIKMSHGKATNKIVAALYFIGTAILGVWIYNPNNGAGVEDYRMLLSIIGLIFLVQGWREVFRDE